MKVKRLRESDVRACARANMRETGERERGTKAKAASVAWYLLPVSSFFRKLMLSFEIKIC